MNIFYVGYSGKPVIVGCSGINGKGNDIMQQMEILKSVVDVYYVEKQFTIRRKNEVDKPT